LFRYAPWDGIYMFHCHNLIHEDHMMMAAMDVQALADLGYNETTRFLDPMEARYRAVSFNEADWLGHTGDFSASSVDAKCKFFVGLDAYRDADAIDAALKAYWSTHSPSATAAAAASTFATSVRPSNGGNNGGGGGNGGGNKGAPAGNQNGSGAKTTSGADNRFVDDRRTAAAVATTTTTSSKAAATRARGGRG